jgi:diguanylate cyclase (GGDEF)-like protein
VVCAAGAAALALALHSVLTAPVPSAWALLVVGALLAPGVLVSIPLRLGNRRVQVAGLVEAALVLSLATGAGAWVVVLLAIVALANEVRLRRPAHRLAFNVAVQVAPAGLALAAVTAVAGSGPHTVADLPALALAAATYLLLNELAVAWVVTAATGGRVTAVLREDAVTSLTGLAVNIGLAAAVLGAVAGRRWELALAAPFVLAAVVRHYRRRLSGVTTTDALGRLRLASSGFTALDGEPVFAEVLERAAQLFGVERAALVLLDWPGTADHVHTRTGPGVLEDRAGRLDAPAGNDLAAPLVLGAGAAATVLGELRLTFPRPPALTTAEQDVLATFCATSAAALGHARDYAEQVRAARLDSLTGLPNRLALHERLEELLPDVLDGRSAGTGVLLLDLDHFKEVNDSLGHGAGDALLVQVAERLRTSCRPGDLVVRLGGDEFAVLVRDCPTGAHARAVAEKLLARLNEPLHVDGLELPVEASVGVALAPRDGTSVEALLRCADVAMYRAKGKRNAAVAYDPALDPAGEDRVRLLAEMGAALREGELRVHYQPLVDLRTGSTVGAEALVRWQHPVHGLLPPGRFIPAAERTALIVPLTLEVLEQAVAEAVTWPQVDGADLTLSVNLSPRCLLARHVPDAVVRILARHGLPARRLVLEITETLAMSDLEVVEEVLTRLRDLGVQLSVDDFGTGYSSMSFLRRVAVHEVKVDRSFVAQAPSSHGDAAIVRATVELAHGLGLGVVGEGVETARQLQFLLDSGCDRAQGYLLARPVEAAVFRAGLGVRSAAVLEAQTRTDAPLRLPAQR